MITVLHGGHEVKIAQEIFRIIQDFHVRGVEVIRLGAKKLTLGDLETSVGTQTLFSTQKLVVIDGLFSLPKSKKKDELLHWLRDHDREDMTIYLLEKKALGVTAQKIFPKANFKLFKYPAVLFAWLESIGAIPASKSLELFHEVLKREEVELCFVMLVRQVRLLLGFIADGTYDGPPFFRTKLSSQARHFTQEHLLSLHSELLDLDEKVKTSSLSMPLAANLDLILCLV